MGRLLTPMTAARGMGALPALVETREGTRALQRLFDRIDLPLSVTAEPDRKLPLYDLMNLFEHAARTVGDPLFGLRVGQGMVDDFGLWSRYTRTAPTLRQCLERATRLLRYHQTGTRLELTVEGDTARYAYRVGLTPPHGGRQHLEHTLPALLRTFRIYAGEAWKPLHIEVAYPAEPRLADIEQMLGVPVHPGCETLALVFPAADLRARLNPDRLRGPVVTRLDLRAMVRERPPETLTGIVAEIVNTRLLDGRTDIDGVANRIGTGVRTLQRQLEQENRSYRAILDHVRMARARHLLAETDQPVTEIALALGYSDPAHFTRAFRRTMAVTPRTYRVGSRNLL